jgi:voltage-gated potassium channel
LSIIVAVFNIARKLRLVVRTRLTYVVIAVASVLILGALLFSVTEHRGIWESFYWAFITMTTIGYGDIYPATAAGRIVAVFVAVSGIASFTAMVSLIADYIITRTSKKMRGELPVKKRGHIIIAGCGESARSVLGELKANLPGTDIVLVDEEGPVIQEGHISTVRGDPSDEEALKKASIDTASHIIVCTGDDSKNLLTVLRARMLNKRARIVAEAQHSGNVGLLRQAGADSVVLTGGLGGMLLASAIFEPSVPDFLIDVASTVVGEADLIEREAGSYAGMRYGEALVKAKEEENSLIVALRREGRLIINPPADLVIREDDRLLLLVTGKEEPV